MANIVLNGREWSSHSALRTWGSLLETVDDDLKRNGQVVTAVRFDGVGIPSYRDADRLGRSLEDLSSIEIDTAATAALLRQGLSEAAGALETLRSEATRVGAGFRGHDVVVANQELVSLAQSLSTLVTLIGVVGQAMDVSFDTFAIAGSTAQALFEETGTQVNALVQSQRDEDWMTVADTLEYDVSPTLARWRDLLTALHERLDATPALEA